MEVYVYTFEIKKIYQSDEWPFTISLRTINRSIRFCGSDQLFKVNRKATLPFLFFHPTPPPTSPHFIVR